MINYKPFFKTLKRQDITQYKLINEYDISTSLLDKLRNNQSITLATVDRLCQILKCSIEDIVEIEISEID